MKTLLRLLTGILIVQTCTSFQVAAAYENTKEWWRTYGEQRDAIEERMKRHGINRDDMAAMRRLMETAPPYTAPHIKIPAEKLLNPGEHYRIEVDDFILTMIVPDAKDVPGQWIWPYTNTRTLDTAMQKYLEQSNGILKVADLGWYVCSNAFLSNVFGRCEVAGISMNYQVLTPKEQEELATPEKMRKVFIEFQKNRVPTQAEIERLQGGHLIDNRMGNRNVLAPEPVVINGRIWIRHAMNGSGGYSRHYQYITLLGPDRRLVVNAGLPNNFDYNANPDQASWPAAIRRAVALHDEMISSLRIARINDDGSPDPFVVERVEPAPLPLREPLPMGQ